MLRYTLDMAGMVLLEVQVPGFRGIEHKVGKEFHQAGQPVLGKCSALENLVEIS